MSALPSLPNSVHQKLAMTKSVPVDRHQQRQIPALEQYFNAFFKAYGQQHWWPGRSRFEIIVGAILTQSTSWKNVDSAIRNLRAERLLTPGEIRRFPIAKLTRLIRPSGYFRQKAKKLKAFTSFLFEAYGGSLTRMFRMQTSTLRSQLLAVHGIGPETADSILLYGGNHPVFVIDTYARRILERHNLASPRQPFEELRSLFESSLPSNPQLFNEYHALIVETGKRFCRKSEALCSECPLKPFLPPSAVQ